VPSRTQRFGLFIALTALVIVALARAL